MIKDILELNDITKVYENGIVANKGISFSLNEGEIHAIVGENGAGKSTLMKILYGLEQPTSGKILFNGKAVDIKNPEMAIDLGIGMVHQHFMLVSSFSVAENLLLSIEPQKGLFIDKKEALRVTSELADKYKFDIKAEMKIKDLTVGMKQKVEILKVLHRGAKILILDEPTAVLTPQETEELFIQLKRLKNQGHTIIFISHKLKEVKEISDRVTIIKRGVFQGMFETKAISEQEISRLMVGRDVVLKYSKTAIEKNTPVYRVRNLSYQKDKINILNKISFDIREGHILGIAGVEGNGQSELIELITGNIPLQEGQVYIGDDETTKLSIDAIRKKGLAYIPEDRMTRGVASEASINDNILANRLMQNDLSQHHILSNQSMMDKGKSLIKDFYVKCSSGLQQVKMLSGGNIQKVVVARECSIKPKVLIAAQPTRGVDIGSIEFIHKEILKLREALTATLLVSADLNEILELSDSIAVMYDGEIVAYFSDSSCVTEEELGLCMLGLKKHSKDQIRKVFNEA